MPVPITSRIPDVYNVYREGGLAYLLEDIVDWGLFHVTKSITPSIYWGLAERYYRSRYRFDTDEYSAPLDPFKVEWVSPDRITRMTGRELPAWNHLPSLAGTIRDGDWDKRTDMRVRPGFTDRKKYDYDLIHAPRFEDTVYFRSLRNHFIDGVAWANTELYRRILQGLSENKPVYRDIQTKREAELRLEYVDRLYDEIAEDGYKPQQTIDPRQRFKNRKGNEILVDVARDGELLFVEGRTRLSITKLLNIDEVTVLFLVRHEEWMETRNGMYKDGLSGTCHPDFSEFSSESTRAISSYVDRGR